MTVDEIVAELRSLGSEQTKNTLLKHGAVEPIFGTKITDMMPLRKRLGHQHALSLELYDAGISDAMCLAALISEPKKMTKPQLQKWAKQSTWSMLSEYAVAWTAAESRFATEMALEWVESKKVTIATSGWATYSSYVAITPDDALDLEEIEMLLSKIPSHINKAPDRVKYVMNGFVISVGSSVPPLTAQAKAVAKQLGLVQISMGETSCKVPLATEYIDKVIAAGKHGKKRKTAFC